MTGITLRVLDGADRGRIFEELTAPVTIGREEGNTIQLNDERVSRFHLKIQEDHDKLVLTDLESTNGTKVNGEDIQLRILRYGDMICVGRSVLLFGNREQIGSRLARLRGEPVEADAKGSGDNLRRGDGGSWGIGGLPPDDVDYQAKLFALDPPGLPDRLSPGQAAQLSELLEYFHLRIRYLLASVRTDGKQDRVTLDAKQWQYLLDSQSRLAEYLRRIGEPGDV